MRKIKYAPIVFLLMLSFFLIKPALCYELVLKPKPGDKIIGPDNWQEVEGRIIPSLIKELKEGWSFILRPKGDVISKVPRQLAEATEKYRGTAKLDPQTGVLTQYYAGFPFPDPDPSDPQTGIKIFYNMYYGYALMGDTVVTAPWDDRGTDDSVVRYCIDKHNNKIDARLSIFMVRGRGRAYYDPKPHIDEFVREKIDKKMIQIITSPRDVAGTTIMAITYYDPKKSDDMWIYMPSVRRIRRYPTTQRYATQAPSDYNWDDSNFFNGRVDDFTYKYIGEKNIVFPAIRGKCLGKIVGWKPEKNSQTFTWGQDKVHVLEQLSKDPNYSYGKKVWYIQKNTYNPLGMDIYDRKGEYWKFIFGTLYDHYTLPDGEPCPAALGSFSRDIQIQHSTITDNIGEKSKYATIHKNGPGVRKEDFCLRKILSLARGGTFR